VRLSPSWSRGEELDLIADLGVGREILGLDLLPADAFGPPCVLAV